jgi:hypothetical protein
MLVLVEVTLIHDEKSISGKLVPAVMQRVISRDNLPRGSVKAARQRQKSLIT